jgi:hypothetical protein
MVNKIAFQTSACARCDGAFKGASPPGNNIHFGTTCARRLLGLQLAGAAGLPL